MPIYSRGIQLKPEGRKLYGSKGAIYTGVPAPALSSGEITITEVTDTTALAGGGFSDGPYCSGGYLYESSDGDGENGYIGLVCFGGQGTMGANPRSDILTESTGLGFSTYDDWVIDGGRKKIIGFQFYRAGGTTYPNLDDMKNPIRDCVEWMQAQYSVSKVYFVASSQGGDALSIMMLDDGDVAGPAWVRDNVDGAYHAAAAWPNGGQDISGLDCVFVIGTSDAIVSYALNSSRVSSINSASTGTPIVQYDIATDHNETTWGDPLEQNRNYVGGSDPYPGLLTHLNSIYTTV